MNTVEFSCDVDVKHPSEQPLNVKIVLNGQVVSSTNVVEKVSLQCNIPSDENREHIIELVVSGKTKHHTIVDETGNVVSSTELLVNNFRFDGINIDSIVLTNSLPYIHNYNDTGDTVVEKFYDTIGCNGKIILAVATPIHLWLLENM
jgi:hypothetical protein